MVNVVAPFIFLLISSQLIDSNRVGDWFDIISHVPKEFGVPMLGMIVKNSVELGTGKDYPLLCLPSFVGGTAHYVVQ